MVEVDPASRERLELETRVLAAALRQSLQLGDMEGSNLAHEQIFILLKARQELMNGPSAAELSRALRASEAGLGHANGQAVQEKTRRIPDIEWFEESSEKAQNPGPEVQVSGSSENTPEEFGLPEAEADKPEVAALGGDGEKAASKELAEPNFYQFFGLEQGADRQDIHRVFLVRVRAILRGIKQRSEPLRGFERQEVLKGLQKVWINHDILQDASTRGDYDQRLSGHAVSDEVPQESKTGATVRIGELLQSSGLLEKTELEIAADMHKAMPELMFGSFLVKQGFVQERDLECVLISQQLIKTGQISLEQFQELMPERGDTGTMFNLLLERGLVTREELDQAIASLPTEEAGIVARALAQETQGAVPDLLEAPVKLTPNNAVPSWKDQLDWSEPEPESQSESQPQSQPEAPAKLPTEAGAASKPELESQAEVAVADALAAQPDGELLSFSPDEGAASILKDAEPAGGVVSREGGEQAESNLGQVSESRIDSLPQSKIDKEPGQSTQERVRKRSLIDLMFDLNPQESLKETPKESLKESPKENAGENPEEFEVEKFQDTSLDNSAENSQNSQSSLPAAVGANEPVASHMSEPSHNADLALESSDVSASGGSREAKDEYEVHNLAGKAEQSPKEGKRPSLDDVLFGGGTDTNRDDKTEASSSYLSSDSDIDSDSDIAGSATKPDAEFIVQEYPQEELQDNAFAEPKETLASETLEVKDEIERINEAASHSPSLDLPDLEPEMDIEKELNDLERLDALDHLDDDGDDLESDTSTELPALESGSKGKAAAKDNWSIVSKPASYLASFLMDEMPARKDKGNTGSSGNAGNTGKKDDEGGRRGFKRKKRN